MTSVLFGYEVNIFSRPLMENLLVFLSGRKGSLNMELLFIILLVVQALFFFPPIYLLYFSSFLSLSSFVSFFKEYR